MVLFPALSVEVNSCLCNFSFFPLPFFYSPTVQWGPSGILSICHILLQCSLFLNLKNLLYSLIYMYTKCQKCSDIQSAQVKRSLQDSWTWFYLLCKCWFGDLFSADHLSAWMSPIGEQTFSGSSRVVWLGSGKVSGWATFTEVRFMEVCLSTYPALSLPGDWSLDLVGQWTFNPVWGLEFLGSDYFYWKKKLCSTSPQPWPWFHQETHFSQS